MTDFDKRLTAALDADDEAFLRELDDERGLFAQFGDTLGGPLAGWTRLAFAATFPMAIFLFVCVWRMFAVDDLREQMLWTAGAIVSAIGVAMLKQWFFERMNLLSVLRELKRIELRIARVDER